MLPAAQRHDAQRTRLHVQLPAMRLCLWRSRHRDNSKPRSSRPAGSSIPLPRCAGAHGQADQQRQAQAANTARKPREPCRGTCALPLWTAWLFGQHLRGMPRQRSAAQ